jgi:subfamily B ATP-binding cassette protein MsbA
MESTENFNKKISYKELAVRIAGFVKPFVFLLIGVLFLNTIFSTFVALSLAVVQPIIELIFGIESSPVSSSIKPIADGFFAEFKEFLYGGIKGLVYEKGNLSGTLLKLSTLLIGIFILKNITKYFASVAQIKFEEGIIKHIRDKVFRNLTFLSVDFFAKNKEGQLISTLTNDVAVVNVSTVAAFTIVLREFIQVLLFVLLLLSISPFLTMIAFSSSIISLILLKIALKYIRKYASRMQTAMADYTSAMHETILGIRVVKAYNAEETAIKRFTNQTFNYVRSAVKHRKVISMIPSINEVFAIIALCIVLFVGGTQVLVTKELSGADLMAFLFYLFAIMSPVALTVENISKFQTGMVAAERVFRVLDTQPTVKTGIENVNGFSEYIEVDNLNFAYQDLGILKNANFKIKKSSKIAFVGPSGSGKSTMLDLLIRFYDPNSGRIKLDGKDIRDFKLESYRSLFGIVGQENMLFNDTVLNNIKYGFESASEQDIISASKIANAYDFIMQLPNGFNTYVGDRGIMLSGGERQRIAIARALVRNPEILVFDEATSALDAESEKIVQNAINKSMENKTAIIVAHRLATIIDCDVIYVFDNGEIIESGTHQELHSKNGIYRKLYEIQYSGRLK